MDYEKKYKEALEWARKVMQGKVGFVLDEVLEKFPELKESEDERIRKAVVDTVMTLSDSPLKTKMLSWLEAQGEQNPAWSKVDKVMLDKVIERLHKHSAGDKEYLDIYYWLIALKDRVLPKQEWSEQEQVRINRIVACLENLDVVDYDILLKDVDWLKSLRPQNTWKPSDEQMKALKEAVDEHFDIDGGALWHLYEDLLKLMEK